MNLLIAILILSVLCGNCITMEAFAQNQRSRGTASISKAALLNSEIPIPPLCPDKDAPWYPIQLRNGKYEEKPIPEALESHWADETPWYVMDNIATGMLDGKPTAVALVTWSEGGGGSGQWEILLLFRLIKGKPKATRFYWLEDRAQVYKISIKNNTIVLNWLKHAYHDNATHPTIHEIKKLHPKQFEVVHE